MTLLSMELLKLLSSVLQRSFLTSSYKPVMTASLASNYDFRSSIDGKFGLIEVQILGFVLDASIVIVIMVLGKTLAVVAIVTGTYTGPSGGAVGWPLCSQACF